MTIENEEFFKYVANYVIMQFLEKVEDMNWVVQFPNNVPSQGRSHIHEVATFYGLTSHSIGSKKRSALVYPSTIFKDKQESEASKKKKEFEKLREKNKGSMVGLENPKTNRDKMICLIYEDKKPEPRQDFIDRLTKEIFHPLDHVPTEYDAYMNFVKGKIEEKKSELAKSKFAESTPVPELGELQT